MISKATFQKIDPRDQIEPCWTIPKCPYGNMVPKKSAKAFCPNCNDDKAKSGGLYRKRDPDEVLRISNSVKIVEQPKEKGIPKPKDLKEIKKK